ncbi:uridine diphosphate-N-acetylglucosamine-binding protein YvcK [Acidothermaceae bacterium B102]|nr:uridine diphosphate-N-acetylglucosamine-binding protein YvcK [Acidothermaceae bacterium B102]
MSPTVVALGGGHGLSATLTALRQVTDRLTAIVTVADDGGSSGRLRDEYPDLLPPGDLRMALVTLAGDSPDGQLWNDVLQYRFPGDGPLGGHAVGNLLMAGLLGVLHDPVHALAEAGRLIGSTGRVLPMSTHPLDIVAQVRDPHSADGQRTVRGQGQVAVSTGVIRVALEPADPPACPEAVAAVLAADLVVLGPGSWFTSVLPHLLVPELAAALHATTARRVLVLNIAAEAGETADFSPQAHLEVLSSYAPDLRVDVVLANEGTVGDREGLLRGARTLGAELVLAQVAVDDGSPRHDPDRLALAFREVLDDSTDHDLSSTDISSTGGHPAWR